MSPNKSKKTDTLAITGNTKTPKLKMNIAGFSTLFLMVMAITVTQQADSDSGQSRDYKDIIVRFKLQLANLYC